MKRTVLLLFLLNATIAMNAQSGSVFTFTFSHNDFKLTRNGDVVSVTARNNDFHNDGTPEQPSLPAKVVKILNRQLERTDTFSCTYTLQPVATNVTLLANGYPMTTDTEPSEADIQPTPATKSLMNPVEMYSGENIQNGFSYATFGIYPYLYDVATRTLYFVNSVTLSTISMTSRAIADNPPVLRRDLFNSTDLINPELMDEYVDVEMKSQAVSTPFSGDFDYLIITDQHLVSAFNELVRWKNQKGVRTRIISTQEISARDSKYVEPRDRIKEFIYQCYVANHITYCLLGGDGTLIEAPICHRLIPYGDDVLESFPSDQFYACFDNNFQWNANNNAKIGEDDDGIDFFPEIVISRFPAYTTTDVKNLVAKILFYEKTPPQSDYVNINAICGAMIANWSDIDGKSDSQDVSERVFANQIPGRWKENLITMFDDGKKSNIEFTGQNMYNLIDGFLPNGAKNNGLHLINVRCHGDFNGWERRAYHGMSPSKYSSVIHAVNQVNSYPTIFITSSCDVNLYDGDQACLSKALLNHRFGALAFIASSRVGILKDLISTAFPLIMNYCSTLICYK